MRRGSLGTIVSLWGSLERAAARGGLLVPADHGYAFVGARQIESQR